MGFRKPNPPAPAAPPRITLLSKLENIRAEKLRERAALEISIRNLDEEIALLKWRPEAEQILESLKRYI